MATSDPPAASTPADRASGCCGLPILSELARIALGEQDTAAMLQNVLACLVEGVEAAEGGALLLYSPSQERLAVQAAHGLAGPDPIGLAGEARCVRAFRTGEPGFYPDGEADDPQPPGSAVYLPLTGGEGRSGVLMVENRHDPGAFARADLPWWQAAADLIALSVQAAHARDDLHAAQASGEADHFKAELITTLAHDMRTPLTSIKGYATALLMEEVTFQPETRQEFLQFIDEECDVLQTLIHDLLESSIIDAGLLAIEPQPMRLPPLVKSVTDDIARHTPIHRFLLDFPEGFPILDADPDRIAQVLRNLLDNAVKYSPEGGLIVVRGEAHAEEVVVSVADQGVGLTAEHLNRLFEKYFRARSSPGRHVVGSGLGLPISRTIVEGHGGRIWAESQAGQGTTLYFALPRGGLSQEGAEPEEREDA